MNLGCKNTTKMAAQKPSSRFALHHTHTAPSSFPSSSSSLGSPL